MSSGDGGGGGLFNVVLQYSAQRPSLADLSVISFPSKPWMRADVYGPFDFIRLMLSNASYVLPYWVESSAMSAMLSAHACRVSIALQRCIVAYSGLSARGGDPVY